MSGKRISIRARRAVSGYLFILPFIIGFLCFMLLPLVDSFWMSLCRVDVTAGQGFQTTFIGLDNYIRGGDPLYEFARFHRKYTEKTKLQEEKSKISAQDAFRNAVVQSVATEVTKQQLLAGKNPMEIIDSLLNQAASYRPEIERRPPEQRQIGYRNRERRSNGRRRYHNRQDED